MKSKDINVIFNSHLKKTKIKPFYSLYDLNHVKNYHESIGIKKTPLYLLPALAKYLKVGKIYIKDESKRFKMNAFKILGSSYGMYQELKNNLNIKKFCTATDGNHGKSVARIAKKMGKESIIFVPKDIVKNRIKMIIEEGAQVVETNEDYDQTVLIARNFVKSKNIKKKYSEYSLIQDTSWDGYELVPLNIMKGYLTQMDEISDQLLDEKINFIFLQSGVGSWAASVIAYIQKHWLYQPNIYSVEPFSANCVFESILYGKSISTKDKGDTIMSGLNCGTISSLAWPILKAGLAGSISISDGLVKEAMRTLAKPKGNDNPIVSGESGASSLAAILGLTKNNNPLSFTEDTNILIINTEGDTDKDNYKNIICS